MVVEGPTVVAVPVRVGRTMEDDWVMESTEEVGIHVVEQPVQMIALTIPLEDGSNGQVTVSVDPGARLAFLVAQITAKGIQSNG